LVVYERHFAALERARVFARPRPQADIADAAQRLLGDALCEITTRNGGIIRRGSPLALLCLRFFFHRQKRFRNSLQSRPRDRLAAYVRKTVRALLNFLQGPLHGTKTSVIISMDGFINLALRQVLRIFFNFPRFTPLVCATAALLRYRCSSSLKLMLQLL